MLETSELSSHPCQGRSSAYVEKGVVVAVWLDGFVGRGQLAFLRRQPGSQPGYLGLCRGPGSIGSAGTDSPGEPEGFFAGSQQPGNSFDPVAAGHITALEAMVGFRYLLQYVAKMAAALEPVDGLWEYLDSIVVIILVAEAIALWRSANQSD